MKKMMLIGLLAVGSTGFLCADKKDELLTAVRQGDAAKVRRILQKADQLEKVDLEKASEKAEDRLYDGSLSRTGWEWAQLVVCAPWCAGNMYGLYMLYRDWDNRIARLNYETHADMSGVAKVIFAGSILFTSGLGYLAYRGLMNPIYRQSATKDIAKIVKDALKKKESEVKTEKVAENKG